jgi:hypothetical protein
VRTGSAISQNALNALLVIRIPVSRNLTVHKSALFYGMKFWIILLMAGMSIGVAIIIAQLTGRKWEKRNRFVVFFLVLAIIWFFFWIGTQ